jgi:hypothetical protein
LPNGWRQFVVLDAQNVAADNPDAGVKTFVLKRKPRVIQCQVFIAGGGMGGIAAAIRAGSQGLRVCLTEETSWLGGQMTSQGVSAFDENYLVETSGATKLYQKLRTIIRDIYRNRPGVSPEAAKNEHFNPGNCWVSRLSFEPRVGLAAITELMAQTLSGQDVQIATRQKVVSLKLDRGRIKSALAVDLDSGRFIEYRARYFLDATELGDLLPLAGVPYASGAEAQEETGEPHAPARSNRENVQDFTYPFVLELSDKVRSCVAKPQHYEEFLQANKFTFGGYKMFQNAPAPPREAEHQAFYSSEYLPFWTYRRLLDKENFPHSLSSDLSLINWNSNDLRGENLIDQPVSVQAQRLALAKNLSLGFLYWLQTAAPRDEGGNGYPEVKLRVETLDSTDGLSKFPYIRESRRIKALRTIVEQDIAAANNDTRRARIFRDSVGIGLYAIDIHGKQDVLGAQQAALPFQIPLAALIQNHVRNLIPACKNIGTTHITNGAYRLHPVEWAIGEAAGCLAALCIKNNAKPSAVAKSRTKLASLQQQLVAAGAPIYWFDDVSTSDPNFEAIQIVSTAGLMTVSPESLSFDSESPMRKGAAETRAQAAERLYGSWRLKNRLKSKQAALM